MARTLVHRGPDGDGAFECDAAAFGHRRLSIVDVPGGGQPMSNETGDVTVCFNGEIYNAPDLFRGLVAGGHRLASRCDTEVLVHLYEEHGSDLVHELRGMFAFAVWDASRGRGMLARDRLGIKPLYYRVEANRLLFASELKGLLSVPTVERSLDPVALDAYLAHHYIPAPLTIFKGIRKLRPGHVLVIDERQVAERCYWRPPPFGGRDTDAPECSVDELRALLEDAVREHLMSDVPLGVFLSGGIDSSVVAALAARAAAEPLRTFCVRFAHETHDEGPFARAVAEHLGTRHEERTVRSDAIGILPELVRHYDEPFGDPSAVPTYYVAQAGARSVKVCLSGDGGDELFGGYERYARALAQARFDRVPRALRRAVAGAAIRVMPEHMTGRGWMQRLGESAPQRYQGEFSGFDAAARRALLSPALREEIAPDGSLFDPHFRDGEGGVDLLSRMQGADLATYLPDCILTKVDRASMAHSLEVRVPLLDHRLVEAAATLSARQKIRNGRRKWILKEATRDLLPPGLLERPKRGFGMPLRAWFRGELEPYARDTLLTGPCRERGLLHGRAVERLLDLHARGRRDFSDRIWSLLVLEHWCRRFLDVPS